MRDFSFAAIFKAAFNAFVKNFTDIFFLTILSSAFIMLISLAFNSVFVYKINDMINDAVMSGSAAAAFNPFLLLLAYACLTVLTIAVFMFFLTSSLMSVCCGNKPRLKDYIPSPYSAAMFALLCVLLMAIFGMIVAGVPILMNKVTAEEGFNAASLAVSVFSFALLTAWVVFLLRYVFTYTALLEDMKLKEALQKSYLITKGSRVKIFILLSVLGLINYIAKIFILPLLFTIPYSLMILIYAYYELDNREIINCGAAAETDASGNAQ